MKQTTLCYLERDNQYLMLHRVKKENDASHDKWIGVGGKCEANESPDECMLREVQEETGLTVSSWRYRGIVTFISDVWPCEYMHLFTATEWHGNEIVCDEGDLQWVDKSLLKLLEGSVVLVPPQGGRKHPDQKMIPVNTKDILFICGGAGRETVVDLSGHAVAKGGLGRVCV